WVCTLTGQTLVVDGSHFEPLISCHSFEVTVPFSLFSSSAVSSAAVSSAPSARSARPKARLCVAFSRHSRVGCSHAPRPGSAAEASTTRSEPRATTLRSEDREARERQPTHVLTGSIVHPPTIGSAGRPASLRGTARRSRPRASAWHRYDSRIESGWMSIFAPVSFAARRAFWPSLPIARDSW
ncbi:MAG: hypothetical protein QOH55_1408, partial [Microbacteriaceae bacterium]|nr:hypothetical protein [Microbacteriaceae bacterium]